MLVEFLLRFVFVSVFFFLLSCFNFFVCAFVCIILCVEEVRIPGCLYADLMTLLFLAYHYLLNCMLQMTSTQPVPPPPPPPQPTDLMLKALQQQQMIEAEKQREAQQKVIAFLFKKK